MSETTVTAGQAQAVKLFSVMLNVEAQRYCPFIRLMAGPAPSEQASRNKRETMQSSPDMPIVIVHDLEKMAGDKVTIDMFKDIIALPFMGSEMMQGKGQQLKFSEFDMKIDQTRQAASGGSRMSQKRTKHNLRMLSKSNLAKYFGKLNDQVIQIHLSGARGSDESSDWNVPLDTHVKFNQVLINPVQPPTSNRYFVAGGDPTVVAIDKTNALTLEDIDVISAVLREMPYPPSPIRVENDAMGEEQPLWCLMVTERQWHYIVTRARATNATDWRSGVASAAMRSNITKHPLFSGTTGMWNGMLIKKMARPIQFNAGDTVKTTNSTTGAIVSTVVPAEIVLHRALLIGGQALAIAKGNSGGGYWPMKWSEEVFDHGDKVEIGAAQMDGKAKFRFEGTDKQITDFGVAVIDSYAPAINSEAGHTLRVALSA